MGGRGPPRRRGVIGLFAPRLRLTPDRHPRVMIVGGAPRPEQVPEGRGVARAVARFIDDSDVVVRMNDLKNKRARWVGRKTDWQVMMNAGHPGERYARKRIGGGGIRPPQQVLWLSVQDDVDARAAARARETTDVAALTARIVARQGWQRRPQHTLDAALLGDLRATLGLPPGGKLPSAGISAIWWAIHSGRFDGHTIHVLGFGWQGWSGHAFDAEADLARGLTAKGHLTPVAVAR